MKVREIVISRSVISKFPERLNGKLTISFPIFGLFLVLPRDPIQRGREEERLDIVSVPICWTGPSVSLKIDRTYVVPSICRTGPDMESTKRTRRRIPSSRCRSPDVNRYLRQCRYKTVTDLALQILPQAELVPRRVRLRVVSHELAIGIDAHGINCTFFPGSIDHLLDM